VADVAVFDVTLTIKSLGCEILPSVIIYDGVFMMTHKQLVVQKVFDVNTIH